MVFMFSMKTSIKFRQCRIWGHSQSLPLIALDQMLREISINTLRTFQRLFTERSRLH
jgi:hypothetical protein